MPKLSKKQKNFWNLFIGDNGRRQYNKICRACVHPCKQSFRAKIVSCPRYYSKKQNRAAKRY